MTKPRRRLRNASLSSAAFRALAELQLDAIDAMKALVQSGAMTPEEMLALIRATAEAITTHQATVIETDHDGSTEDADEDRGDTASA